MTAAVMIQGTGSNAGKSLLVAGLCRALTRRGLRVRPFKPQNMSNNAAVTADGGEIGRAQALQALACGVEPLIDMNPVLLKPESETGAQVIVQGRHLTTAKARDYATLKTELLGAVTRSFRRLSESCDIVIVEGAGSPAETNLRRGDIANMGFAAAAGVPVILAGDIDRGGVIAQIVGTHTVLGDSDRILVKAFLVNKFRGDPDLFADGMAEIERRTGWPPAGLVPWFAEAAKLPAEDALDIRGGGGGGVKIAVPLLSRIANFDDLDPLRMEPEVTVAMIPPGAPLPGDADLVILPGTKATIADLAFFRAQGWDIDLKAHVRRGGHVLGICGGYQMLGRTIADPHGVEGAPAEVEGLGLLDIATAMHPAKTLDRVSGRHIPTGQPVAGYEIHIGRSEGPDTARGWLEIGSRREGAVSADGRVSGCYVHGVFAADGFRRVFLEKLGAAGSALAYGEEVEAALDALAAHLERHVNIDLVMTIALAVGRG
ncbi:MAG: cobyric acid synthase [Paracoccaceae bacterium]